MKKIVVLIVTCVALLIGVKELMERSARRNIVIDVDKRPPTDKREFRAITLPNKLSVLLISDVNLNKSAAAMDVGIGSLADPIEHQGLAHFLEHMLFLGTKKYPEVEEYTRYLHANQGMSNAFTADEDTNYFFEVNHDAFAGALDRFAQFFVEPLFNTEFVERELNAVNSEHQKNLQSDLWRLMRIEHSLLKADHPRRKFSTGDTKTLAGTSRNVLIDFYRKHYSANQMKLVVMSKLTLDEQQKLITEYFTGVPNFDRERPTYPAEMYDPKSLPRFVNVKPVKDMKKLNLLFEIPAKDKYWETKPDYLISFLVGYEGKGSLLSLLKQENLASGLASWVEAYTFAGSLHVDIELTDKGVESRDRVLQYFFAYIKLLQREGLKRYLYDERKIMSELDYVYREHKEGGNVASAYASRMQVHPPLLIDKNDQLYKRYGEDDFKLFLSFIKPTNMTAFFVNRNVQTTEREPYYDAEYGLEPVNAQLLQSLVNVEIPPSLALPEKNMFIPESFDLHTAKAPAEPVKTIDNDWGTFWFQPDDRFQLPKGNIRLILQTERVNKNPVDKMMSLLYVSALNEGLNEWSYDLSLAGLNFAVARADTGIQIDVGGFADKIDDVLASLAQRLTTITITEQTFTDIKEDLKRNIRNASLDVAYRQLVYHLKYLSQQEIIHHHKFYNPLGEDKLDLISPVTLDQLKQYAKEVYAELAIQGAAYGNMESAPVKKSIESFYGILNPKVLPKDRRPEEKTLVFQSGQPLASVMVAETNNNCWGQVLQFGRRDPILNAAIRIGHAHLQTSFYTNLRTKQQLGYVVHSGLDFHEKSLGLLFLVQSSQYSPFEIAQRAFTWSQEAIKELEALTEDEFNTYRTAVVAEMREEDKTMQERLDTLLMEAILMKGEFHYKEKIAKAAETLTREQMVAAYRKAFLTDPASLSVYLMTKKAEFSLSRETLIKDETSFKATSSSF